MVVVNIYPYIRVCIVCIIVYIWEGKCILALYKRPLPSVIQFNSIAIRLWRRIFARSFLNNHVWWMRYMFSQPYTHIQHTHTTLPHALVPPRAAIYFISCGCAALGPSSHLFAHTHTERKGIFDLIHKNWKGSCATHIILNYILIGSFTYYEKKMSLTIRLLLLLLLWRRYIRLCTCAILII